MARRRNGKKKNRKKSSSSKPRKKNSGGYTSKRKRRAKRKSNPSRRAKRKSNPKKRKRRRNPDYNVVMSKASDLLPVVGYGALGFMAPGLLDALWNNKATTKLAEMFAGKGKTPTYGNHAAARLALDAGFMWLGWWATKKSPTLRKYRKPIMTGLGIRTAIHAADALFNPGKADDFSAKVRTSFGLPPLRGGAAGGTGAALKGTNFQAVEYDAANKRLLDENHQPLAYVWDAEGIARNKADNRVLLDNSSARMVMKTTHTALAGYYEDWSLGGGGEEPYYDDYSSLPDPGYTANAWEDWDSQGVGNAWEDWETDEYADEDGDGMVGGGYGQPY